MLITRTNSPVVVAVETVATVEEIERHWLAVRNRT